MTSYSNTYTLQLDLKKSIANIVPVFVQNDTATLYIKVTDSGNPYDLSTADRYTISFKRPDNVTTIGQGTFENGMLTYVLQSTEMQVEGSVEVIAQFYSGTTRISTKPFTIKILGDISQNAVDSSSSQTLIQQLIADGDYAKAQGEALGHKGNYDGTVVYKQNNIVSYNNINYVCIQDTTAGIDPTNGSYWTQLSPLVTINSQTWTATDGQTVFTITNGSYATNSNNITITVGNVLQTPSAYAETSSTSFTLSEAVSAGTTVYAKWFEGAASISKTHHTTHQAGGQDELDVTLLKNYSIVSNHIGNTSNPHGVTASQVGAYSKSESDSNYYNKSTSDSKYMMALTSGSTANRPSSPTVGQHYFNTDTHREEYWDSSAWRGIMGDTYEVSFVASGSVNNLQTTFTFPTAYPTGTKISVTPSDITQQISFCDTMAFPLIFSVSNSGFTVKVNTAVSTNNFGSGTLKMNFVVRPI